MSVQASGWEARLALGFARRGKRTLLARREHSGPLVVQKPLYPEGPGVCQAVIVHPPGGIAGGDRLAVSLEVGEGAHAQLTTPGATRWYRSAGSVARQTLDASVADGAMLEWLPQENIVFESAHAKLTSRIVLAGSAAFIGFDIVCLGRTASGEKFERGSYRQCVELVRDGALVWAEGAIVDAGDGLLQSPVGLNGCPMFGTFVVAASDTALSDDVVAACRRVALLDETFVDGALTRLPGVLVARCRGTSPHAARQWFTALWSAVRPALCGCDVVLPRIWNT